jgi:PleD family two-component response regulator
VRLAEQIRRAITDQPYTCAGRTFRIGASIGIVPVHNGGSSLAQLLSAADAACYQAKRRGGNRVQLSDSAVRENSAALQPEFRTPDAVCWRTVGFNG